MALSTSIKVLQFLSLEPLLLADERDDGSSCCWLAREETTQSTVCTNETMFEVEESVSSERATSAIRYFCCSSRPAVVAVGDDEWSASYVLNGCC